MKGSRLHFDVETRSACDLRKAGAAVYFAHPSTSVLCFCWRFDDGPVGKWFPGTDFPLDVFQHVGRGGIVVGHNIGFDRQAWNACLQPIVKMKIEQTSCTMARARALSLPPSLAHLGEALKIPMPKDMEGHALMMKLCKPRSVAEDGTITWWGTPSEIHRLADYCARDVEAETLIDGVLPELSPAERATWILDQKLNERGVKVDVEAAKRAVAIAEVARGALDKRMKAVTGGAVPKTTQVAKLASWLNERGIKCESVGKGEMADLIMYTQVMDDADAEEALELRREAAKSSTAKYAAMVATAGADGRVRGALEYNVALSRRWGGRGMQPQNFPRTMEEDDEIIAETLGALLGSFSIADAVERLQILIDSPMAGLSKTLRSMIIADLENVLIGGDFTNIEGRLAAWIAGAQWKLDAFTAYDRDVGPDLYKVMAAGILHKLIEDVSKKERQEYGKVPELACGYQGGVGAFQKMAAGLGIKIGNSVAAEIVQGWREANPEIVDAWYVLGDAAAKAVDNPGTKISVLQGRVSYLVTKGFLFCRLPSGGVIAYPNPHMKWEQRRNKATQELMWEDEDKKRPKMDRKLKYWAEDPTTKKFSPQDLYGGAQFAHVVSGTARDLMVEAMHRVEPHYPLVLTVHDELLSEVPEGKANEEHYNELMEIPPDWADDLPLAATTWSGPRYVK